MGRKLLLTPFGDPRRRAPEKQAVGTVTESHKMLTLQALSSSLIAGTARGGGLPGPRRGCWVPSGSLSANIIETIEVSGKSKTAFSDLWLCLSDTRHFRHFRRFRGPEKRSPCFQWVRIHIRHFRLFRQNGSFLAGDKNTVFLSITCLCHPENWRGMPTILGVNFEGGGA